MLNMKSIILVLLMTIIKILQGYNIELRDQNFIKLMKGPEPETKPRSRNTVLLGSMPSYFGYSFAVDNSTRPPRIFVGAPKTVSNLQSVQSYKAGYPPQAPGALYSCQNNLNSDENVVNTCTKSPVVPSNGDALGLNVLPLQDGNQTICTTNRLQACGGLSLQPGYCYRGINPDTSDTYDKGSLKKDCRLQTLDIMFVIDGSTSVGTKNFKLIKDWVKEVSTRFKTSDPTAQIGIVQYSNYDHRKPLNAQPTIKTEVRLADYPDERIFNATVDRIRWQHSMTYTAHALNKTVLDFQASSRYASAINQKVLILLTDGRSKASFRLKDTSNYLRSIGITTFAVGVKDAPIDELLIITNNKNRVYEVDDFAVLTKIVGSLKAKVMKLALEGGSKRSPKNSSYGLQYAAIGFSGTNSYVSSFYEYAC